MIASIIKNLYLYQLGPWASIISFKCILNMNYTSPHHSTVCCYGTIIVSPWKFNHEFSLFIIELRLKSDVQQLITISMKTEIKLGSENGLNAQIWSWIPFARKTLLMTITKMKLTIRITKQKDLHKMTRSLICSCLLSFLWWK